MSGFYWGGTASPAVMKARVKQMLAGAAEGTIANSSETPGNYRPAIVDSIPALAGVVASLINRHKDGRPTDGSSYVEQVINNSTRRAQLASERTNQTLGINNPSNTNELGLRVIGGLLIPGPKGTSIVKGLSRSATGLKAVRAAEAVTRATPKIVRKVTKLATEVALPLRQTHVGTAGAVGIGMTAVLDPLLDGSVDPSTGVKYKGTVREALGMKHQLTLSDLVAGEDGSAPPEAMDDIDNMMMQTAISSGDADPDAILAPPVHDKEVAQVEHDNTLGRYEGAALAIGAVTLGVGMTKYSGDFLKARRAASTIPENIPAFTSKQFRKSRLGTADKLITNVAQQDHPIRSMAEDFLGRDYAKKWGYKADRMTNVSIGARTRGLFQTGEMPGTNAKTVKLAPLAEAYAKELTPQEQRLVSDALNGASALDDYKRTGVLASLNRDMDGNPVTAKQLDNLVQGVRSNPKYAKYFEQIQKSYDDLAKFRVLRGRDTMEGYNQLRKDRPNYVAMNRNLERDTDVSITSARYSANEDQGLGASRSMEEGGGVQGTTGVGNPFVALFDEWTNEVRRSDLNDLRADFLVNMDASGALNSKGSKIIQAVSPNAAGDDIHIVRINGKQQAFRVSDPHVNKALHMSPRASIKILESIRQTNQSMTTGALASVFNMFTAIKTPIYDTTMGLLIRPKGVKLGLLNEALNTNLPDPTAVVSAYTGAARYLWDDMKGSIATTLRDNVIRDHSWLKSTLGEKNLDNLATVFENAYENSIKADLDRTGITSITMHGSPDASELVSGINQFAPHFADAAGNILREDIDAAKLAGNISGFAATLGKSRSMFGKVKANMLVRAYGNVLESLHNGFRYSAHAANKASITDLDKHISDMRRLSADSAQHGGSDLLNQSLGSFAYANLGVQSLYELGRRAAESPTNFLFNVGSTLAVAAGLHYAAIGSDPDAAEKHSKKTPQQKASSLTTFGGNEIPLDPVMRLFASALFPIYDQISGLNNGKYNPDFFNVMETWLEGDAPQMDEASHKDQSVQLWQAVQDNNPFQPSGFVPGNILMANAGVDVGMSRMTGEAMMEKEQNLTGTEAGTRRPDSLGSAHLENMMTALFSTVGRSLYGMADDMYRAYGKSHDIDKSVQVGVDRWQDTASRGAGPVHSILFPNSPTIESAADVNYQLMKSRDVGIEQALKMYQTDVRTGRLTSSFKPKYSEFMPAEDGVLPPEVNGTEAGYIAEMANQLERQYLSKNRQILGALGEKVEGYNAQYLSKISDRTKAINQINEERRYQRMMMLTTTRQYEEVISQRLGKPFTFKDFNPKDYLTPLAPVN